MNDACPACERRVDGHVLDMLLDAGAIEEHVLEVLHEHLGELIDAIDDLPVDPTERARLLAHAEAAAAATEAAYDLANARASAACQLREDPPLGS